MLASMTSSSSELLTRAVESVVPRELAEAKLASGKPMRLYLGIDPTGAKLHLGHSVPLRKLRAFQDAGHHVIFLIGSFTAMIGDPSGRDVLREPLDKKQVEKNFDTYKEQTKSILDFSKLEIRFNHEWLEKLRFDKIIQIASHFTVQQMLERDMFQKRMKEGKPISPHEFLYPLMVGYDSVMLDVDCELGGSDQLFNMLAGRTLQKAFGKREKFVLTTKLIEGTDGRKMSKTYDNCIYLEDDAAEMFGKTMSIKDELIAIYMECCTDIPMVEIDEAKRAMEMGANPKDFKVHLAKEIVKMYHGSDAVPQAEEEFQRIFLNDGIPDEIPEIQSEKGELLIDLLVRAKVVASKTEVKRLIAQKGIALNDVIVVAIDQIAEQGVVRVGKRKFLKIL